MQLTINIPNEQLFEKIIWLLNSFQSQGLEIVESSHNLSKKNILKNLEQSISEVHMIKEGKLKATNARDLLDEL